MVCQVFSWLRQILVAWRNCAFSLWTRWGLDTGSSNKECFLGIVKIGKGYTREQLIEMPVCSAVNVDPIIIPFSCWKVNRDSGCFSPPSHSLQSRTCQAESTQILSSGFASRFSPLWVIISSSRIGVNIKLPLISKVNFMVVLCTLILILLSSVTTVFI